MKKIIGIVFISLMFCNIGYAKITLLWEDRIKGKNSAEYFISTICVDGYMFVVTKSGTHRFNKYSSVYDTTLPK